MKFSVKNALRVLAAALFVVAATPVFSQITAHSGEVSAHVGWNNLQGIDGKDKHIQFGFGGGVNVTHKFAVGGEYIFLTQGSVNVLGVDVGAHYQNVGAVARYSFLQSRRTAVYGVAAGGYARATAGASSSGVNVSTSSNGGYVGLGGGASIYLAPRWGVRPEVRWDRQMFGNNSISKDTNDVRGTIGVFYQFGGR